jgi:large subunit ribosomal protein L9
MQVILTKDVDNLGGIGELVTVRPGYARNYLLPQKFAVEATPGALKQVAEREKVVRKREEKLLAEINKVRDEMAKGPIRIGAKVGTSGKIFGSVTSIQIARAIREQKGYDIDRRKISIIGDVQEVGTHKAQIDFGKENIVDLDIEVVGE